MHNDLANRAHRVGFNYRFDKTIIANSIKVLRIIQFAKQQGLGDAAKERLFSAYTLLKGKVSEI